jgi:hypothetical protein
MHRLYSIIIIEQFMAFFPVLLHTKFLLRISGFSDFSTSGILYSRRHNVSETGYVLSRGMEGGRHLLYWVLRKS